MTRLVVTTWIVVYLSHLLAWFDSFIRIAYLYLLGSSQIELLASIIRALLASASNETSKSLHPRAWEANILVYTGQALNYSPFAAGNPIALGGICSFSFLIANVLFARHFQDRLTLAVGMVLGAAGEFIMLAVLKTDSASHGSLFAVWFLVALGFNLASTVTLSLLSKQLPARWNNSTSLMIQYSNFTGRVTGAVWGGAGTQVGMIIYVCMQIGIVAIGCIMFSVLWKQLKAKPGEWSLDQFKYCWQLLMCRSLSFNTNRKLWGTCLTLCLFACAFLLTRGPVKRIQQG